MLCVNLNGGMVQEALTLLLACMPQTCTEPPNKVAVPWCCMSLLFITLHMMLLLLLLLLFGASMSGVKVYLRACPLWQLLWCACAGGLVQHIIEALIKLELHAGQHSTGQHRSAPAQDQQTWYVLHLQAWLGGLCNMRRCCWWMA